MSRIRSLNPYEQVEETEKIKAKVIELHEKVQDAVQDLRRLQAVLCLSSGTTIDGMIAEIRRLQDCCRKK